MSWLTSLRIAALAAIAGMFAAALASSPVIGSVRVSAVDSITAPVNDYVPRTRTGGGNNTGGGITIDHGGSSLVEVPTTTQDSGHSQPAPSITLHRTAALRVSSR